MIKILLSVMLTLVCMVSAIAQGVTYKATSMYEYKMLGVGYEEEDLELLNSYDVETTLVITDNSLTITQNGQSLSLDLISIHNNDAGTEVHMVIQNRDGQHIMMLVYDGDCFRLMNRDKQTLFWFLGIEEVKTGSSNSSGNWYSTE